MLSVQLALRNTSFLVAGYNRFKSVTDAVSERFREKGRLRLDAKLETMMVKYVMPLMIAKQINPRDPLGSFSTFTDEVLRAVLPPEDPKSLPPPSSAADDDDDDDIISGL